MPRLEARQLQIRCPYCDQQQGFETSSVFDEDELLACLYCGVLFVVQTHVEVTVSTRELVGGRVESERTRARRRATSQEPSLAGA